MRALFLFQVWEFLFFHLQGIQDFQKIGLYKPIIFTHNMYVVSGQVFNNAA